MEIRKATFADLPTILSIYQAARSFMRQNGNPNQWGDHHPAPELLEKNIADGNLYVCTADKEIAAVFFFRIGSDPTYEIIHNGQWLNDKPYGVIHHIAVAAQSKGIAGFCFDYALSQCPNIKIDTHADNLPMQRCLTKNGFHPCGTIFLPNGDPRIAYQKSNP